MVLAAVVVSIAGAASAAALVLFQLNNRTTASTCSNVDISFARGTGQAPGLGDVGRSFTADLSAVLVGRSVTTYAVDYAAAKDQRSVGAGSIDLVRHVTGLAATCPNTRFVIAGYSQGASVIDFAVGLFGTNGGQQLSADLSPRIAAIVVFGNPLGLTHRSIEAASPTYGPITKSYCNPGDPICGAGWNVLAHQDYASNGSTLDAAKFALQHLR